MYTFILRHLAELVLMRVTVNSVIRQDFPLFQTSLKIKNLIPSYITGSRFWGLIPKRHTHLKLKYMTDLYIGYFYKGKSPS